MARVQADVEALKALRQALLTYAGRQSDALQSAEGEISYTMQLLDEAEQRSRRQVEHRQAALQSCLAEAAHAASQGYAADCSACEYALREAEEHLTRIVQWQARVQEAVAAYRAAAQRLMGALENDLPRATAYLTDRITALEAYHATQVLTAAALASAGIAAAMGGVIAAVRRSRGELSRVMGSLGEQVAAQVLSEQKG